MDNAIQIREIKCNAKTCTRHWHIKSAVLNMQQVNKLAEKLQNLFNHKKRKSYNCINTLYSSFHCDEMHHFKIIAHNITMHLIKNNDNPTSFLSTCQGAKIFSDW